MAVRRFALVFGAIYLVVGLLGFIPVSPILEGSSFDNFGPGGGYLLGQFPVNYVHDVVHALIGVWGLASRGSAAAAVRYARVLGVAYVVLAVYGAVSFAIGSLPTDPLVPVGGLDVFLHLISGGVALYFGFGKPSRAALTA